MIQSFVSSIIHAGIGKLNKAYYTLTCINDTDLPLIRDLDDTNFTVFLFISPSQPTKYFSTIR